ncbi:peroxidase family protein [Devosia sp.]|uniref:peroxidase family protein n=1 Tax=Devosia sp. TaxID=1871048 RepID=UPI003A900DC8
MQHMKPHSITPDFVPRSTSYDGRFGRLFGRLPPWVPPGDKDEDRIRNIEDFAINHMLPKDDGSPQDHPTLPAGYTYFGQFIDHDITFDPTSSLERQNDPDGLKNFRTPRLDLDSVYGRGPKDQPYLYEHDEKGNTTGLLITGVGANGKEPDLARVAQQNKAVALIGDPRNDENIIVSQLQLAIIRLHNVVLARVSEASPGLSTMERFHEAQCVVRWFYQYLVWNDFVKRIVPDDIWATALADKGKGLGLELGYKGVYSWEVNPYIPVEFSVAAYRFGHSLIRRGYQLNFPRQGAFGTEHELPIFNPDGSKTDDLRGGRQLPKDHTVQWDFFFDLDGEDGFPQKAGLFDTTLSPGVTNIPSEDDSAPNPLASLNIQRGWRFHLPSGPAVAQAMGFEPVKMEHEMQNALWVYILHEAQVQQGGNTLGQVGGTIVAAVFAGLLKGDHLSYVSQNPTWSPDKDPLLAGGPRRPNAGKEWTIGDLLAIAKMPINSGDVENAIAGNG